MGRTARHLSVIATAVAVIAIAGIWYSGPVLPSFVRQVASDQPSALTGPFTATYDFLTPTQGWAVVVDYSALNTRFFIFHTDDGAAHWYKQYFGHAKGDRPYLHFFDGNNGFAYVGLSYRTVDGGAHWYPIRVPGSQPYVSFASATYGWAQWTRAGAQYLYRTYDGGTTWTDMGVVPAADSVLPVLEPQTATFSGGGCEGGMGAATSGSPATVFITNDCGGSWVSTALLAPDVAGTTYETAVRVVPGDSMMAFVSDGSTQVVGAFMTFDGGETWRGVPFPTRLSAPEAVSFVDLDHWWILGAGSIYTSEDGGALWVPVHEAGIPPGWQLEVGGAIDAYRAWGILSSSSNPQVSRLAMTADGGAHWQTVSAPEP